jgi:hypothetical protein
MGTTTDFNVTRDQLIKDALIKIGVLSHADLLPIELKERGIILLNLILREMDKTGKNLWAITATPSTLTLVDNTFLYTTSNGLQNNILKLVSMAFRNVDGSDTELDILSTVGYEKINEKIESGDPERVYLTEDKDIASRQLYVWPTPLTVNTQSVVVGTDGNDYRAIRNHDATTDDKPITGANYLLFWEATGGSGSGSVWAAGTSYTAPQLLRYTYRKPLFDFDLGTDNPDMPQAWSRILGYRLASDFADDGEFGVSSSVKRFLDGKYQESLIDLKRTEEHFVTDIHNKTLFF